MIQLLFETTPGVEIFAIVALLFFFLIFAIALFWALSIEKSYLNHLKYLPFDSDNQDGEKNHDKKDL